MHAGFNSGPLVGDADLIIVIESDAPWYPGMQQPAAGCRVAHIGEDPVFVRYPMRSFPSDLSIASPAAIVLAALDAALAQKKLNVEARRAQADRAPQRAPRESREGGERDRAELGDLQPRDRRSGRRGRDHLQRISAQPRPLRARTARHVLRPLARRADSAGAWAPRSAPSSRRRRNSWSRPSATAPTCSPIRPCATGSPTSSSCRCSPSCSTTAATARCGARRSRCSRTARRARTTASSSPICRPRRRSRSSCARRAAMASASRHSPSSPLRSTRARDAVRGGKQALVNVLIPN